jgi:chromosome segregation ATPase
MYRIYRPVAIIALCALGSVNLAAADSANKELGNLKKELQDVAKNVDKYGAQLERTMTSLEAVKTADSKSLPKAFKAFQKDSNNLNKQFKSASSKMKNMREKRDRYFAAWAKSSASISIPELKQAAEERREHVAAEHSKLTEETAGLAGRIDTFMPKLGDLQQFMGSDLSPTAIAAAAPTIDGVLAEGRSLAPDVRGLASKFGGFAGGL